jgi:4-aminobutyrate aminotransferase-like enzyme
MPHDIPIRSADELLALRRHHLGPSLSLSYQQPLKIVRGRGQYLYDEADRAYMDGVNNVCHVGHSHPRVVSAIADQASRLNTNTRYLHDGIVEYALRLTATLPEPLSVCYFVCSGTEANELALRLARTYTGRQDVIALDHAYHGNSAATIDISPYKFNSRGGRGAPPWVHIAPAPDTYRGLYRSPKTNLGMRYAAHVSSLAAAHPPAAFIAESILSCGGQIVLPDGFLAAAYAAVRAAGGVCIADEVQVGFGRVGLHFWAFETQGVVPDIFTMGKPIGNGHPMGAVVTTPAIAEAFNNGMEYFNTFGGNPVSCAAGLAVLDVIEDEGLQRHALDTGAYFMNQLREVMDRHSVIGDVRGLGLFIGIEFVSDRETRTPDAATASAAVEALKAEGILLSTDGPDHNVIKIKPPLPFDQENAGQITRALDAWLGRL